MTDPHIPAAPDAVAGGSDAAATPPLTPPTPGAAPSAPAVPPAPPYAAPAYQPPTYQAPAYPPPAYPGAAPQPGYAPPAGYAAPPAPGYGAPYGYAPARKTNTLAIVSMIAAIVGFIWVLPFVGSLAGAIMGHLSLGQIKRTGEGGRGMALTGVILGWIGVAIAVLIGIFFIIAIFYGAANGARYGSA